MGVHKKTLAKQAVAAGGYKQQMRYERAVKLADKNSRTIQKISQLTEVTSQANYAKCDPDGILTKICDKLKARLNRRLIKLARFADCPAEDRQADFRAFVRLTRRDHSLKPIQAPTQVTPIAPSSSSIPTRETRQSEASASVPASAESKSAESNEKTAEESKSGATSESAITYQAGSKELKEESKEGIKEGSVEEKGLGTESAESEKGSSEEPVKEVKEDL
jgi:hypothetical protein